MPTITHGQKNNGLKKTGLTYKTGYIENKGQIVDQNNNTNPAVLYLLNTPGMKVQIRRGGFSYDVYSVINSQRSTLCFHRIDIDLTGYDKNCKITAEEPSSIQMNYYTTETPIEGVTHVRSYGKVIFSRIYPGIDIEFLVDSARGFKYNIIVHPGGDLASVTMKIRGAESGVNPAGNLEMKTSLGTIEETIPASHFAGIVGVDKASVGFVTLGKDMFGLTLYNTLPTGATLVVDPIPGRMWATYYGGADWDNFEYGSCAISNQGEIISSGTTQSTANIATTGAFQTTYKGNTDGFIVKFDHNGQPVWATYYGGTEQESSLNCTTEPSGNVFLSGTTNSSTNISTPGSHQPDYGGWTDGFLVKFDPNGLRQWATYYGGIETDGCSSCVTDGTGNVYICGSAHSSSGISTPGSHQPNIGSTTGGNAYLAKFDPQGMRIWATYYGGNMVEGGYSCKADANGHVMMCGLSRSANNVSTPGAHQELPGGGIDGFLVLFNSDGQRQWGTYYGGVANDELWYCTFSNDGNIYVSGQAASTNNISTPGSHQPSLIGNPDALVARFNLAGVRQWGTYYGGVGFSISWGCAADDSANIFICGQTNAHDFISTAGSFQPVYGGDNLDAFLVKFNPGGVRQWGTYYGGTITDCGSACATIGDTIYLTGRAGPGLATPGSYQPNSAGVSDGILVKFVDCDVPDSAALITGPNSLCSPSSGEIYSIPAIPSATGYTWEVPSGATIVSGQNTNTITVDFGAGAVSGIIIVKGINGCGPGEPSQSAIEVLPRPVPTITGSQDPCVGDNKTYTTETGKTVYTWSYSPGGSMTNGGTGIDNFIDVTWSMPGPQWIQVSYTDVNGCTASTSTQLDVIVSSGQAVGLIIEGSANTICPGTQVTYTATPANPGTSPVYQWKVNGSNAGGNSPVFIYTPANGDIVQCILASSISVCISNNPATSNSITMVVNTLQPVSVSVSPASNPVCAGTQVNFTAIPVNGGITPQYQWKVNGLIVVTNSPAYSYVPLNGDVITCSLTSNVLCPSGNPAISNMVTMSVNPILPVGVSIAASTNPFCSGSPVTFTAIPINSGIIPLFQWKVNGISAGSNNPIFTYIPLNGDLVTCSLVSSETCTSGNPAQSNPITMLVNATMPAGITIVASSNPFCPGTVVTFTATPGNGGTSPTYQWIVNGSNAGTNSPIFAYNPANNDSVRCVMTSNLNCVTSNPASSGKIIMIGSLAPNVSFITCFDTVTTISAKPYKLKGGIPLGGTFSGPGVNPVTGVFTPSAAGTGLKTILYTYTNVLSCSANMSKTILVQPNPSFTCGNNFTDIRDNKIYPTVQIGAQCWVQTNLDFGVTIGDFTQQTDNCISERYLSLVNSHSSFYQWDELMRYDPVSASQGICPPGWHVPTSSEWDQLLSFYNGPGLAGGAIKDDLLPNGFQSHQMGFLYMNNTWAFTTGLAAGTMYWTSTSSGADRAVARGLNEHNMSVSRYEAARGNGFSVRCLRD